jgi:hypothetical protein
MTYNNIQTNGNPVQVLDEGISLSTNVASLNFAGDGVTGTAVGAAITETISGYAGSPSHSEVPTGTVSGTNVTFTLAHTPKSGTLKLYVNGSRQQLTSDYTLSTATITFVVAPELGSIILADYTY